MITAFSFIYTYNFFQTWFHTYLVKARGFSEKDLLLSSLPFALAVCANLAGGLASHLLVLRIGLKWGRCALGVLGLAVATACTTAVMFTHSPTMALALLSLTYGAITLQQPIMFAVCLDIGGFYAGAMVGAHEHVLSARRVSGLTGLRIPGGPHRQLQRGVPPHGGPALAGDLSLVAHRPHRTTHCRNRAQRAGSAVGGASRLSEGFLGER